MPNQKQDQRQAHRQSHLKPREAGSLHQFFDQGGRHVDRSGFLRHGVIGSLLSSLFPRCLPTRPSLFRPRNDASFDGNHQMRQGALA